MKSVNAIPGQGIQPLSQNLRFCQLPLHRGAENTPQTLGAGFSQGSRETPCKPSVRVFRRGAENARRKPSVRVFHRGAGNARRPLNGRGRRLAGKSENFLERKKLNRKSTTYVLCLCSDEEQERFLLSNYQRHRAGIAAGLCAKPSLAAAKGVFLKIQNSFKKTHGSSFAFRRRKPWAAQTGSTRRRKPPAFFPKQPPTNIIFRL